jgi:hypothetical protein
LFWQLLSAAVVVAGAVSVAIGIRRLRVSRARPCQWGSLVARVYATMCLLAALVACVSLVGWIFVPSLLLAAGLSLAGAIGWERNRPHGPFLVAVAAAVICVTAVAARSSVGVHSRLRLLLDRIALGHAIAAAAAGVAACWLAASARTRFPRTSNSP